MANQEMADLAPVQRNPRGKSYRRTMSDTAEEFRDILKNFKASVFNGLDSVTKDKHDEKWLDEATDKIIQLGNTLVLLLNKQYDPIDHDKETNKSIQSIHEMFKSNGIDLESLDDSTRNECSQIIEYDIYWYPHSLSEAHTESLVKNRVQ